MAALQHEPDEFIITFARIGNNTDVPTLTLPLGPVEEVRRRIHEYVAARLGFSDFSIVLWREHGFIDLGTHSAGAFRIQPPLFNDEPEWLAHRKKAQAKHARHLKLQR